MAHNKWSDDEKQIIINNYKEMSDEELSQLIPRHSISSITTMRKNLKCIREKGKYSFDVVLMYLERKGYSVLSESSEYKDACSNIRYLCPEHGEQTTTLGHLIEGKGCKQCGYEITAQKKRKDVALRVNEDIEHCNRLDLTYVDTYRKHYENGRSKIMVKYICNKHRDKGVQEVKRYDLYKAQYSCKYCYPTSYTHEEIKEKLSAFESHFEFISNDYERVYDRVLCRCKKHGIVRSTIIKDILRGQGCVECGLEKLSATNTLTLDEVKQKISEINPHVELISEYKSHKEPITVCCQVCGTEWETHVYTMFRCPTCDFYSKGEQLTANYLNEFQIKYIPQYKFDDCKHIKQLLFDFYLPDMNVCIEYNGLQHYQPCDMFGGEEQFKTQQIRDNIKRQYCKDNGIKLIEIPYTYNTKEKIEAYLKENM